MNIVFLIHGTWGKGESAWYQANTESRGFAENLESALLECGIETNSVSFIPFEWSGLNSHEARVEGAKALSAMLLKMSEENPKATFHFVAHSHGGNVVLKALEIYLNERPSELSPKIIDIRDEVESSKSFLKDYSEGKFQFKTSPNEVNKLIAELSGILKTISNRESKRYRASFIDGSIYDAEQGRLKHILAKLYRHVFGLSKYHQIGGFVTMGTPFYEKRWKLTRFEKLSHLSLHWVSFIPVALLIVYFYSILINGVLSLSPWVSWVGFNPLSWHKLHLGITGALALILAQRLAKTDRMEAPVDTNVYFDEATIPYYLQILANNKICRVLNIHSSYLDEAYWLLASYPLMADRLGEYLKKVIRPKLWAYISPTKDVGFWYKSPSALINRRIKQFQRLLLAFLLFVLHPFRIIFHSIGSIYIAKNLKTRVRSLAYGLPIDEFSRSSEITVHPGLAKKYFQTEMRDVTREIVKSHDIEKSEEYFSFLWNESVLDNRLSESIIAKTLGLKLDLEQSRQVIALEERAREYYGLAGIRHSMYYSNKAVINHIAIFISACIKSKEDDVEVDSHILKIPRRPF